MTFTDYLKTNAEEINKEIDMFFYTWIKDVEKVSAELLPLAQAFHNASHGGKRIRATLVRLGYELSGASFTRDIWKPAVAMEINQTAVLAHDDIIDKSLTRRGKPTLYQILGGGHYAISQTIVLGDIGFFLAMKLLVENSFSVVGKNRGVRFFVDTMIGTGIGQILDSAFPAERKFYNSNDAVTIMTLKTARYTIAAPLQIGAALGGASETLLNILGKFGELIGITYQIDDDINGIFADEKSLGKTVGTDIKEGKVTLLITEAMKRGTIKQKKFLNTYYGNPAITSSEIKQIQEIFRQLKVVEYAKKEIHILAQKAKKMIPQITRDKEMEGMLLELAEFFVR